MLHVPYLIFNEGYASSVGSDLQRVELSREAIRLARMLHDPLPDEGSRRRRAPGGTPPFQGRLPPSSGCPTLLISSAIPVGRTFHRRRMGRTKIQDMTTRIHDSALRVTHLHADRSPRNQQDRIAEIVGRLR
ncbi:DUF6596 domain-containing protein [Streptosporangium carneum]|uniref:DUF6596 domain-containing protein n=1 Tax=Streptosporangium carneum TaxID=47481 RepID=A0A9W6MGN6_9ACTN|nr:DUF6596 domain-containing protein [Streptosporangium carneum]GLK13093.1 hypothetical protein GCM10017600_65040 [Streptosporangium carneum]